MVNENFPTAASQELFAGSALPELPSRRPLRQRDFR
jgi:hypothetical protein